MPIDGSKNTTCALEIAMAKQFGATLTGVYSMNIQGDSEIQGMVAVNKKMND